MSIKIGIECHLTLTSLLLEAFASVLKPLSIFTDALAGEKCITVPVIRPFLKHILNELLAASQDDSSFIKNLKEAISDKLQAEYLNQNVSMILDVCSFLDPRFHITYLANNTSTLVRIENEACEVTDEMINEDVDCGIIGKNATTYVPNKTEGIGSNFGDPLN